MRIEAFQGRYRFLSNFWLTPIRWRGMTFPSVEHGIPGGEVLRGRTE